MNILLSSLKLFFTSFNILFVCGERFKVIRSDHGGEYTSTDFTLYLTKEGIRNEPAIPHNPQQNDTAEKMNRTLVILYVQC